MANKKPLETYVERQFDAYHTGVVEQLFNQLKEQTSGDSKIVSLDTMGAKGDGKTIDDNCIPNGDYIYQLTEGKTYMVSNEKFMAIHNNPVIGKGKIRCESANPWKTKPYANNTMVLPTHGDNVYELSERKPMNRFEECIEYICDKNSHENLVMGRTKKVQSVKPKSTYTGKYHNIGAVYYSHDDVDSLPDQFTICIGREGVFQKKNSEERWTKTIDNPTIGVSGYCKNYALPWSGNSNRDWNHTPQIVDGHFELVVDKEELTSWLGTQTEKTEACVHFWGTTHHFAANEWDELIDFWQIWVKEPEASGKLIFASGIDTNKDADSEEDYFIQSIISAPMPLIDKPQMYWGCTMNIDLARTVNYEDLMTQLYETQDGWLTETEGAGRNYNLLGVKPFELSNNKYSVKHGEDDVYVFEVTDENGTDTSITMKDYLITNPPIKQGEVYRFNCEFIEAPDNGYMFNLYYSNKSVDVSKYNMKLMHDNVYSKVITAETDFSNLSIFTSAKFFTNLKVRLWITKGEDFHEYAKYGDEVKGYVLADQIVDKYLEDKIAALELRIAALENPA